MMKIDNLNIAIFGAGLVGSYLGGLLAHAGCPVTFIGRHKFKWELEHKGLTLTHYKRPNIFIPSNNFRIEIEPQAVTKAHIIFLCVKSQDTVAAAESLKAYAPHDAMVISAQNGVGNTDLLKSILLQNVILGGVIPYNIVKKAPTIYHCGTEGSLILETHHNPRLQTLIKAFKKSGEKPKIERNIEPVQWAKLLMNLNNGLNALWGGTLKAGLMQRPYRLALAAMLEEALLITQRAGVELKPVGRAGPEKTIKTLRLPNILFRPVMNNMLKIDEAARSSMLEDLENGKSSEIDYLQGEVIRLAKMSRQAAPINLAVFKHVKAAFASGRSPQMSGDELWRVVRDLQP